MARPPEQPCDLPDVGVDTELTEHPLMFLFFEDDRRVRQLVTEGDLWWGQAPSALRTIFDGRYRFRSHRRP